MVFGDFRGEWRPSGAMGQILDRIEVKQGGNVWRLYLL